MVFWGKAIQLLRIWGTRILAPSPRLTPHPPKTALNLGKRSPILGSKLLRPQSGPFWPHPTPQGKETMGLRGYDPQSPQPPESKSLLQHHNSKASILRHSAFFMDQLSYPYMTTGKTTALTRWAFVNKVMSLPFNMLSRFVIAFPPRSKHLLISWLQSPSAVILKPKKIKSFTASTFPPFCLS